MLQWMGGSRRKVATSRQSTQKRQKQYFEQRRRQLQHQQTTGVENNSDGMNTCSQHENKNRSLDVLSMMNLTKVQDSRSSCHSAAKTGELFEAAVLTENYDMEKSLKTKLAEMIAPGDNIKFKEARNGSPHHIGNVYSNKNSSSAVDVPVSEMKKNDDKADQIKMDSEHELSVFDILGDEDGSNERLERSPAQEAHVAFAIEGLGRVETETPTHSPQQPGRTTGYDYSASFKDAKWAQSSRNHMNMFYDFGLVEAGMSEDIKVPVCGDSPELPFRSRGVSNSFSKPKMSPAAQFTGNVRKSTSYFVDGTVFDIEEENDSIWKASPDISEANFLYEDDCLTEKNSPVQTDHTYADYWNFGADDISDFGFDGSDIQKMRVKKKTAGRLDTSELPAPYSKQRISDYDDDFMIPHESWHPRSGGNYDDRYVTRQPAWSSYVTEDVGDSFSLRSEESCSSSVARGTAARSPPSSSGERPNVERHGRRCTPQANKFSVEDIYAKDRHFAYDDNILEEKKVPMKFTKMFGETTSKPSKLSNKIFQENVGSGKTSLFEEGYNLADRNPRSSSFSPIAKKRTSTHSGLWSEDPFGELHGNGESSFRRSKDSKRDLLPELHASVKSPYGGRSQHDLFFDVSPSGCFSSEKYVFCQPHSNIFCSEESPSFSNVGSAGASKPIFFKDSKVEGIPGGDSFIIGDSEEEEFHPVSEAESVAIHGETRSETKLTNNSKMEIPDVCNGSNDLTSGNTLLSGLKDSSSGSKKPKSSPDDNGEITSDKFEDSADEKECPMETQTCLPPQLDGSADVEDSGGQGGRKVESNSIGTCYQQVMLFESYVLQLLCVQKVLKETSVKDMMVKKV